VPLYELTAKLNKRIGKNISMHVVKHELQRLGLDRVSEQKLEALASRSK